MLRVVEASVRWYGGIRTDPSTSLRMTWGKIASSCLLAMTVWLASSEGLVLLRHASTQ